MIAPATKLLSDVERVEYVDRSDRVFTSPRRVKFYEMEYALPLDSLPEALERLRKMVPTLTSQVTWPVEVRASAGDDAHLSTAHGRPTGYLAMHVGKGGETDEYFRASEEIMMDYGGRPHWGKMHYRDASSLAEAYPRWNAFQAIRADLDPGGRFTNDYVNRVLGPVVG